MVHRLEDDVRALAEMRERTAEADSARDLDLLVGFLADDVVLMPPFMDPLEGKAACEAFMREVLSEAGERASRYRSAEMRIIGDTAVDRGTYQMTFTPPGGSSEVECGNYVWISERQPDGSWKTARAIWNVTSQSGGDRE
jgi:ketosteroid isomerase-like protein